MNGIYLIKKGEFKIQKKFQMEKLDEIKVLEREILELHNEGDNYEMQIRLDRFVKKGVKKLRNKDKENVYSGSAVNKILSYRAPSILNVSYWCNCIMKSYYINYFFYGKLTLFIYY